MIQLVKKKKKDWCEEQLVKIEKIIDLLKHKNIKIVQNK